jgi:enoyl-CoA hydratase
VRVIVMRASGDHFSAGHDVSPEGAAAWFAEVRPQERGLAGLYDWEQEHYLANALRWREVPKPSIAAVQGWCIGGGLMLCWPCDLIIAADDARFSDPTVRMGIGGVELHAHAWELGPRKAKELLFTAGRIDAPEAERLGMVNLVVPRPELDDHVMTLAKEIAKKDPFALRQAKRAVNQTLDVIGFTAAIRATFDIHQTGHGHALSVSGGESTLLISDVDTMRKGLR